MPAAPGRTSLIGSRTTTSARSSQWVGSAGTAVAGRVRRVSRPSRGASNRAGARLRAAAGHGTPSGSTIGAVRRLW
jgi:hypothetical protein